MKITKFTKALLDFMLWAGILAAFSLPVSLKILGDYFPEYRRYYLPFAGVPVSLRHFRGADYPGASIYVPDSSRFRLLRGEECNQSEENVSLQLLHCGTDRDSIISGDDPGGYGGGAGVPDRGAVQPGAGRCLRSGCYLQAGK